MSTHITVAGLVLASLMVAAAPAHADCDELEIVPAAQALRRCYGWGMLCVSGTEPMQVHSAEFAAVEIALPLPKVVARKRGDDGPWKFDLVANLKQAALRGNTIFVIHEAEESAVQNREIVALYQAEGPGGKTIGARMTLSPNDGFHAGHAYRIRIVQLIARHEVVLAEGDVALE